MRRLADWLRRALVLQRQAAGQVKATRKQLRQTHARLIELADELEFGPLWSRLEEAHHAGTAGYKGQVSALRALAEVTQDTEASLPTPQARPQFEDAALYFVHLVHARGDAPPSLYDDGPFVVEFLAVLEAAGAPKSAVTARNMLSRALERFDPFMQPPGLADLIP